MGPGGLRAKQPIEEAGSQEGEEPGQAPRPSGLARPSSGDFPHGPCQGEDRDRLLAQEGNQEGHASDCAPPDLSGSFRGPHFQEREEGEQGECGGGKIHPALDPPDGFGVGREESEDHSRDPRGGPTACRVQGRLVHRGCRQQVPEQIGEVVPGRIRSPEPVIRAVQEGDDGTVVIEGQVSHPHPTTEDRRKAEIASDQRIAQNDQNVVEDEIEAQGPDEGRGRHEPEEDESPRPCALVGPEQPADGLGRASRPVHLPAPGAARLCISSRILSISRLAVCRTHSLLECSYISCQSSRAVSRCPVLAYRRAMNRGMYSGRPGSRSASFHQRSAAAWSGRSRK